MATKRELIDSLFDRGPNDSAIGWLVLTELPEPYFRRVVAEHNGKLCRGLEQVPADEIRLRQEMERLRIVSYEAFQAMLAGASSDEVPAHYRKRNDFETYRAWVVGVPPIATLFRETFLEERFAAYVPERYRRRHCFVVARSGSGKSETLKLLGVSAKLLDNELRRDRSLVVVDPHGDLVQEIARLRPCFEDVVGWSGGGDSGDGGGDGGDVPDLVYIDPALGVSEGRFPILNPFDIAGRGYDDFQVERTAQQLTRVIQSLVYGSSEGGLTVNMETLLQPCITVLLRRSGSTLFDLLRFLQLEGNDDLVRLGQESRNAGHRYFFEQSFADSRFKLTKAALSTKIQSLLNNQAFAQMLARPESTVDLERVLNTGHTLLVNCATGRVGAQVSEAMGRFVVGMIMSIAFNRAEQAISTRLPIWMVIDEAQRFVSDEIRVILSETRKYGLHLTLATQVVGQGMSPQLTKIVLGNTDVKMIGTAGHDSRMVMSREMNLHGMSLTGLGVGAFVVQCGERPAIRMQMSDRYVGNREAVSGDEWRVVRRRMLDLYYAESAPVAVSETTTAPMRSMVSRPRFEETNPFEEG